MGNIPLQAERHPGRRQKLFAFPPESAFTFRPEYCSDSQRNGVRLQTGIAFIFDRIPHSKQLLVSRGVLPVLRSQPDWQHNGDEDEEKAKSHKRSFQSNTSLFSVR